MEYGITVITRDFGPLNPSPTLGAPTMDKEMTFKDMMHTTSIKRGKGNIKELAEEIGDNGVERLQGMKIITTDLDGNWSLINIGWELVDLFNRNE